jgi:hypothetical protein
VNVTTVPGGPNDGLASNVAVGGHSSASPPSIVIVRVALLAPLGPEIGSGQRG